MGGKFGVSLKLHDMARIAASKAVVRGFSKALQVCLLRGSVPLSLALSLASSCSSVSLSTVSAALSNSLARPFSLSPLLLSQYAVVAGMLSQLRIKTRLDAFAAVLKEIAESDSASTNELPHLMEQGYPHLSLDSLTQNAFFTFEKLLFLPIFMLVYCRHTVHQILVA